MKKQLIAFISIFVLASCTTISGRYTVKAYDEAGKQLSQNINFTASGSGIYSVRNALCSKYPKAVVMIHNIDTGEELAGESPYQCR